MKMVMAYIRHEAFEPIRTELLTLGFPSLTISEVKGSGRQKGITERYRGAELTNYLRPKIKLECGVAERVVLREPRRGEDAAGQRAPDARQAVSGGRPDRVVDPLVDRDHA